MMDKAKYHKKKEVQKFLVNFRIPTLFPSLYSPYLFPVRLFFSKLKSGDLNPEADPKNKK